MDETGGAYLFRSLSDSTTPVQTGFVVEEFETTLPEESMTQLAGEIVKQSILPPPQSMRIGGALSSIAHAESILPTSSTDRP